VLAAIPSSDKLSDESDLESESSAILHFFRLPELFDRNLSRLFCSRVERLVFSDDIKLKDDLQNINKPATVVNHNRFHLPRGM